MDENTHLDFVGHEQAKILKELGFDYECNHWYHTKEKTLFMSNGYSNHNALSDLALSAPTFGQVLKWMRERHFHIYIIYEIGTDENEEQFDSWRTHIDVMHMDDVIKLPEVFSTYEDAVSAGIDKVLNIFKKSNDFLKKYI